MKSRHDFPTQVEYYEYLRSVYAGMAMQGMVASYTHRTPDVTSMAEFSTRAADALIKELNKPTDGK